MNHIFTVNEKKSDFVANTVFDYKKLCFKKEGLLACVIEEKDEELIFQYDICEKQEFLQIQKENMIRKLSILVNVYKLQALCEEYAFDLNPDNLYYDICGNVYVMRRDIIDNEQSERNFVQEYKALAGSVLLKKFAYEDYMEGNQSIMKKNPVLVKLCDCISAEEIYRVLTEELNAVLIEERVNKTNVDKKTYRFLSIYAVCSLVIILLLGCGLYYTWQIERPFLNASIQSGYAYIDTNYVGIIDALKEVSLDKMDKHDKYILAMSYIKSENLTVEQKENILASLSVNENEKILNYWIAIGRLETEEAVNIAMQCSDDELLLYAYLKQRDMVEQNSEMDGSEKQSKLEELNDEIEALTEKYETVEEE